MANLLHSARLKDFVTKILLYLSTNDRSRSTPYACVVAQTYLTNHWHLVGVQLTILDRAGINMQLILSYLNYLSGIVAIHKCTVTVKKCTQTSEYYTRLDEKGMQICRLVYDHDDRTHLSIQFK